MKTVLVLGASKLCMCRLPCPRLMTKLIKLEYDLGGPNSLATNGNGSSQQQVIFYSNRKTRKGPKKERRRLTCKEFREFNKFTPFPHAIGY